MTSERAPAAAGVTYSAPLLMVGSALLFSAVGVCAKLASAQYGAGEIVFYRGLVGALFMGALMLRTGQTLRTPVPYVHLRRSLTGTAALVLWFHSLVGLPLATASTLNYLSAVWMALFLVGGALFLGHRRPDGRLVAAVGVGFAGVALILRPTLGDQQVLYGLAGVGSGLFAAMAFFQLKSLTRLGEPDSRIVLYFCVANMAGGAALMTVGGVNPHTVPGLGLLLLIGLLAVLAQVMLTRAYSVGRVLTLGTLQYIGIVFSFGWGVLLFGEPVSLYAVAGGVLIVAAGIAATRASQAAPAEAEANARH